jgi:pyruvate dehydrogenase E2 component (dihydrolipoamide acetyltransferase)
MSEFRMPQLGADMEAGTLARWLKQPGERVARGDIIAIVETEKGAIEVEVFEDGTLDRVLVQPGEKVPVGTLLALVRDGAPPARAGRASPAARRAADTLGVDLATLTGSGPGGAITRADVERAAAAAVKPAAAPEPRAPARAAAAGESTTAMRRAITAAMTRAKRDIPHVYLSTTIDMTPVLEWLSAYNQRQPVEQRALPIAVFVKALAKAAVDVPEVNGVYVDGSFRPGPGVHVGCAIALRDGGLVAPALHDADRKPLSVVMNELSDLVTRARQGGLRSSELSDPTITLTNLGDLGVEQAFAIIYPPQVAIVAFGRLLSRPWVTEGRIEARTVAHVSLSADHRVVDGRRAGQFLEAIERWLHNPEQL